MVTDFLTWIEKRITLDEKGARTSLGPYPRLYGYAGTHPPLASTPIAAGAAGSLMANHPDVVRDTNPKKKKTIGEARKTTKLPRYEVRVGTANGNRTVFRTNDLAQAVEMAKREVAAGDPAWQSTFVFDTIRMNIVDTWNFANLRPADAKGF